MYVGKIEIVHVSVEMCGGRGDNSTLGRLMEMSSQLQAPSPLTSMK
jgi:hypothetical protein